MIASIAAVLAARHEEAAAPRTRTAWICVIAYWLFTIVLAFEMAAGALWDLLRIEYVRVVLTHLGYPLYLLDILGVWRIPCALVLLVPRFPRLKEWAYAGAIFNYTGAVASHLLAGDRAGWAGPLVLAAFTLASWMLRPETRRLPKLAPAGEMRAVTWYVPILIVVAMLVFAFFTLPKGAPPQ
ncbi:MAG TPA: DoxX family protein [Acidobacteriaceae bacterium]